MTVTKLRFKPGVIKDETTTAAEGFYTDADKVRFNLGRPELMGGFEAALNGSVSGVCRAIHTWASNDLTKYIGFGTHTHLQAYVGGGLVDITPVDTSGTLANDPFTTTISTSNVAVLHTAHGRSEGDRVQFSGATDVGGITIDGEYTVGTVTDVNNYIITDDQTATSSATGGGAAVDFTYLIPSGNTNSIGGRGYGTGVYGVDEYGSPRSIDISLRTWSLDNWGEFLLANARGLNIYEWQLDATTPTPAVKLSGSPDQVQTMFVTPERHVVACGCEDLSNTFDPLLVRWSAQEDNTDWIPVAINQSGSFRLTQGSLIVRGLPAGGGQSLIWTDRALFSMEFLGDPLLVFSFNLIANGVGLIGPNAATVKDGVAYWMTPEGQFVAYAGGTPQIILSGLNRDLFENIAPVQEQKIFCTQNSQFNEIWWFWPDARLGGNEINSYIAYNTIEGHWTTGTFDRTSWEDSGVWGFPVATSAAGDVFFQEKGESANGAAIEGLLTSSFLDVADGDRFQNITDIIPDFQDLQGIASISLLHRNYPNGEITETVPLEFNASTLHKNIRVTARQVAYKITSTGNPGKWRSGDIGIDVKPVGARR